MADPLLNKCVTNWTTEIFYAINMLFVSNMPKYALLNHWYIVWKYTLKTSYAQTVQLFYVMHKYATINML